MEEKGLSAGGAAREAIGFAGAQFETALRLTWLPVLLLGGWYMWLDGPGDGFVDRAPFDAGRAALRFVLFQFAPLCLAAMYLGPLLRLAGRGEAPDHGTAPLRLGASPLRYVAGSLLSLGGAALVSMPVIAGARGLVGVTDTLRSKEAAVFEEGSLHAVDFVPAIDPGRLDLLVAAPVLLGVVCVALLWAWGLPRLGAAILVCVLIAAQLLFGTALSGFLPMAPPGFAPFLPSFFLLMAYVTLRLMPLPWFWAARRREDGWPVLRSTLRASAGLNRMRLIGVLLLLAAFNLVLGWLLMFVPAAFGLGLAASDALLSGTTSIFNGGAPADWVGTVLSAVRVVFGYVFTVATTAVGAGVTAGFGGALVRRFAH